MRMAASRFVFVLTAALLSSCSAVMHTATVRQHGLKEPAVPIAELPGKYPDLPYLRDAAAFSAAVYADVPLDQPLAAIDPSPAAGWTERTDIPRPFLPDVRQTPALTYRLWVRTGEQPRVALLVFRGTHIPADWISNLRWVDFWLPLEDHYEQTERITPVIVDWIRRQYGNDTVIFAAGHSLGGGLAQTAAYRSCGAIRTVFAFDSSPVTKHRARNSCGDGGAPKYFYRVFEKYEILSHARFAVRLALGLRAAEPQITEVKVHLFEGVAVRAHSMQKLAAKMAAELDGTR
jgi:hypothetical protein